MPRILAVDLGTHSVKMTTFRVSGRNVVPEERYHERVPQDGNMPSLEAQLAALDALVDGMPSLRAGGGDAVIAALPASRATLHRVPMPFSDRGQIEQTLPFTVESEVPFDLDEMVLAWRISETLDQTIVMTVMARSDVVSELLQALAERKLDPEDLVVDADAYGPWGFGGDGAGQSIPILDDLGEDGDTEELVGEHRGTPLMAVVDVGHTHTVVSVVRGGKVQFGRSVNVGGWNLTKAIQGALDCTWEEAEARKHGTLGAPEGAPPPASGYPFLSDVARRAVDDTLGLLLAELRSTLIRAEDSLHGEVKEIRLAGGTSRIEELWDYISRDLGVPVAAALAPDGSQVPPEFCLGLALGGAASADGDPINLRVAEHSFRGGTNVLRAVLLYGTAATAVFTAAALVMFVVQIVSLWSEEAELQTRITDLVVQTFPDIPPGTVDSAGKALALFAAETEEAAMRADLVGNVEGVPETMDLFHDLSQAFPPSAEVRVEVAELTITPGATINFTAETDGYAESSAVERALKESERFKTAEKGQETRSSAGKVRFPITITLDGSVSSEAEEG